MSANGTGRRPPGDRVLEGVLDVVQALGQHDRPAVHLRVERPGWLAKTGSRSSARLIFTVPDRVCQPRMSSTKSAGRSRWVDAAAGTRSAGCAVVITTGAAISSPLASATPVTRPPLVVICATSRAGAHLGAERPGRRGQRRRHAAHPAAREAPGAGLAAGVADVVVQHHVGGARRPRAGPGPDHAGHRQQPAHGVALEVAGRCRSAMLPVSSRVTSTAPLVSSLRRWRSSRPWRHRSAGRREPSRGGISSSIGPSIAPRLARCAS